MLISCKPNLALDAIFFMDKLRWDYGEANIEESVWKNARNKVDELDLAGMPGDPSASMLAMALTMYGTADELENMTLPQLKGIFEEPSELIAEIRRKMDERRLGGYFNNLLGDSLPVLEEHRNRFADLTGAIIESGFTQDWHDSVRPKLSAVCADLNSDFEARDLNALFENMRRLKDKGDLPEKITMYLSHYSSPVSCSLFNGRFLQSCEDLGNWRYLLRVAVHELLHGFASVELTDLYREAASNDEYLRNLLEGNVWNSGDEEMFVKAAEHYLAYREGIYTREEILEIQNGLYGNSLPLTVIVFDMLAREDAVPCDLDKWLIGQFEIGAIKAGSIREQCDSIISGYSRRLDKTYGSVGAYISRQKRLGLY